MSDKAGPEGHQPPVKARTLRLRAGLLRSGRYALMMVVIGAYLLALIATANGRRPASILVSGADARGHQLSAQTPTPGQPAVLPAWVGRSTIIVVVIGAFLLSLIGAATARPPASIPVSGAERFVGPDGHREILAGAGADPAQVRETGHAPGNRVWTDGPWWFYLGLHDMNAAMKQYWIVETEDDSLGSTAHLMRLDRTGLRTRVTGWPEIRHFEPMRPEVPAHPVPGQRITTTGQTQRVDADHPETYSSVLEVSAATAVGPDCLEFLRTDTIGTATPVTSSRVRCPGRGVVRLELPLGRWDAVAGWPAKNDPRTAVNLTAPPLGPLRGLTPHAIEIIRLGMPTPVSAAGPLLSTGENYVLPAMPTGHLLWLAPGSEGFEMTAWADTGGDLVGIAQCGDVIVAATSQRTVVAQDTKGRWLWTTELTDVAGSQLVRVADNLLVTTKDGRLTSLGCRDGIAQWAIDGTGGTVTPAVGPDGILVAGDRRVRLLDPATGQQRWDRPLPAQPSVLGFLGPVALAVDENNLVHGLSISDGRREWRHSIVDPVVELHDLGELGAVRTGAGFVGIDKHGQRRWQVGFRALDSVSDGREVFAADLGGIVVIDAAGHTVERKRAPMGAIGAMGWFHLARTPTGVTAADGLGTLIDWRVS